MAADILNNITGNFLSPTSFTFNLSRLPTLTQYVQKVGVPSVNGGSATQPTPLLQIPIRGDQLKYGVLGVTFKLDDKLDNYAELYDWLVDLNHPDSFTESAKISSDTAKGQMQLEAANEGLYSDAQIFVLNAQRQPFLAFHLIKIFPTMLSEFMFDSTVQDINYITCHTIFRFQTFHIEKLT